MDEALINNIHKYLEKSGLPLEIESSSKLKTHGWKIRNQSYYFDKGLMKPRTIDIHATKLTLLENNDIIDRLIITLIIECKTSDKPWLFYTEEYEDEKDHLIGYLTWLKKIKLPSDEIFFKKYELFFGNHSHYFWHENERISIIGDVMHVGKDALYEAACQVTKALNFSKNQLSEIMPRDFVKPYVIFYPVIIFSGNMFEIMYDNGEWNIEEIKYISYNFSGVTEEQEEYLIEVVHQEYLDEYLRVLDREYKVTLEQLEAKLQYINK